MTSRKRVLVLNGSPRGEKSNTMHLTRAFLSGLPEDWDVTEVTLREEKILPCQECFCCWLQTPGKCVLQDDMQRIYALIDQADVIIESFPLHFFGMSTLMKLMTDRCLPYLTPWMQLPPEDEIHSVAEFRHPWLRRKRLVVISTCGFTDAEAMFPALRMQYDKICEGHHYSAIFCPEGEIFINPRLERQSSRYLEAVTAAGREFAEHGSLSEETEASLSRPILSHDTFRMLSAEHWPSAVAESNRKKRS